MKKNQHGRRTAKRKVPVKKTIRSRAKTRVKPLAKKLFVKKDTRPSEAKARILGNVNLLLFKGGQFRVDNQKSDKTIVAQLKKGINNAGRVFLKLGDVVRKGIREPEKGSWVPASYIPFFSASLEDCLHVRGSAIRITFRDRRNIKYTIRAKGSRGTVDFSEAKPRRERPSEAKDKVFANAERFNGWLLKIASHPFVEVSEIKGAGRFDGRLVTDLKDRVVTVNSGREDWKPDNSQLSRKVLIADMRFLRASRFKVIFLDNRTGEWFTLLAEKSKEYAALKTALQPASPMQQAPATAPPAAADNLAIDEMQRQDDVADPARDLNNRFLDGVIQVISHIPEKHSIYQGGAKVTLVDGILSVVPRWMAWTSDENPDSPSWEAAAMNIDHIPITSLSNFHADPGKTRVVFDVKLLEGSETPDETIELLTKDAAGLLKREDVIGLPPETLTGELLRPFETGQAREEWPENPILQGGTKELVFDETSLHILFNWLARKETTGWVKIEPEAFLLEQETWCIWEYVEGERLVILDLRFEVIYTLLLPGDPEFLQKEVVDQISGTPDAAA